MRKISIAKYSIIQGLVFGTDQANNHYLQKQHQQIKTTTVNNNKINKKVRFNRSAGHTSSKKKNATPVNIELTLIEQQEITNNYLFESKNSHNRKHCDKKATLELKKLRQIKSLMQNTSLDQEKNKNYNE